jgi:hypothetical protein
MPWRVTGLVIFPHAIFLTQHRRTLWEIGLHITILGVVSRRRRGRALVKLIWWSIAMGLFLQLRHSSRRAVVGIQTATPSLIWRKANASSSTFTSVVRSGFHNKAVRRLASRAPLLGQCQQSCTSFRKGAPDWTTGGRKRNWRLSGNVVDWI